ncbi:MAG: beta-ketoacyl-[Desulfovibrio sp.]|nr:beta-ketoacyl-[acyl-carrier-protein] synthase family protein [Desulfovibrio sp.]
MSEANAVAITGYGGICAAGKSPGEIWESLLNGACEPSPPFSLDQAGLKALNYPAFLLNYPDLGLRRHYSAADTLNLARLCARQALAMGQLASLEEQNACLVMGTTAGSALHFLSGYQKIRQGELKPSPDLLEYRTSNLALALGAEFKVGGPKITISNACTSGADAIGLGFDYLCTGQGDLALVGGADALGIIPHTGFARLLIASSQRVRPFDQRRQGLNLGEGAACLLLENAEHAKKRRATIYGYVRGYGQGQDAYHFTAPHPLGLGLSQAIRQALALAKAKASDISFINAHGTGTIENDRVEGRTLLKIFQDTPVWASKGTTGHTLGAAGALEALFCLLALKAKLIPKSQGFAVPDPEIGLQPTCQSQLCLGKLALSTSLGFGGNNAALLIEGEKNAGRS